jgi:hypothetical protein
MLTYIYICISRDRHAFQLTRGVTAEISLTIYLYIVATTFITLIMINQTMITNIYIVFGAHFLLYPSLELRYKCYKEFKKKFVVHSCHHWETTL